MDKIGPDDPRSRAQRINQPSPAASGPLSITAVERDTGLSKDTLRVWERRYGFPQPERDAAGERAYPMAQVERLRALKRLLDAGHRPGRVVALPLDDLLRLAEAAPRSPGAAAAAPPGAELGELLEILRRHDLLALRRRLGQLRAHLGLGRFVVAVIAPLNTLVGESWMRGQLEVFEEHLYTEAAQAVLREAIATVPVPPASARPRVLLTTFPGEPHGLGLLMAEALFVLEGATCLSLGVRTPVWDIVLAARAVRADIVALGFTGCMNPNQVVEGLTELRAKLAPQAELWAGGAAPVLHRRRVPGVTPVARLEQLAAEVQRWRRTLA